MLTPFNLKTERRSPRAEGSGLNIDIVFITSAIAFCHLIRSVNKGLNGKHQRRMNCA